jgi:hypothetical protein
VPLIRLGASSQFSNIFVSVIRTFELYLVSSRTLALLYPPSSYSRVLKLNCMALQYIRCDNLVTVEALNTLNVIIQHKTIRSDLIHILTQFEQLFLPLLVSSQYSMGSPKIRSLPSPSRNTNYLSELLLISIDNFHSCTCNIIYVENSYALHLVVIGKACSL